MGGFLTLSQNSPDLPAPDSTPETTRSQSRGTFTLELEKLGWWDPPRGWFDLGNLVINPNESKEASLQAESFSEGEGVCSTSTDASSIGPFGSDPCWVDVDEESLENSRD